MTHPLVLASGSPRRRQLLTQLGLEFDIELPDIDETVLDGEAPQDYVVRLSRGKAAAVHDRLGTDPLCTDPLRTDKVIIAADTTVELGGNILGKPASKEEGLAMLAALSGSEHQVFTGVTVRRNDQVRSLCSGSLVRFRQLSAGEMDYYWETGEPVDKAGGYGLQGIGAAFVESINGSYSNVIGLPLSETVIVLRSFGIRCLGDSNPAEQELLSLKGSRNG